MTNLLTKSGGSKGFVVFIALIGLPAVNPVVNEASAAIVSGSTADSATSFNKIAPPPPSDLDNLNDGNTLFGFDEAQNTTVSSSFSVDEATPLKPTGDFQVGETISSQYLAFDPTTSVGIEANIEFDADILGTTFDDNDLSKTSQFEISGVSYTTGGFDGLEVFQDSLSLFSSNTLKVDLETAGLFDGIRVLTESSTSSTPVPAPASIVLLAASLAGFGVFTRRLQKQDLPR